MKFPFTPMGVLSPRSAHTRHFAWPPIDMSVNFPAHMSAESPSNISQNPKNSFPKFRNPWTTFKLFKKPKNAPREPVGMGPIFVWLICPIQARTPFWLLPHLTKRKDLSYPKEIKEWAEDWFYIHQRASQPASQPASRTTNLESNLYLSNHWMDHPQVLSLSLADRTKI